MQRTRREWAILKTKRVLHEREMDFTNLGMGSDQLGERTLVHRHFRCFDVHDDVEPTLGHVVIEHGDLSIHRRHITHGCSKGQESTHARRAKLGGAAPGGTR